MTKLLWRSSLLAVAALSLPLSAQSGLTYGIKFGAGPVLSAVGEQRARAAVNLALTLEKSLGKDSAFFAEAGYRFFRAEDHEVTRFGVGYAPGGVTGTIVNTSSVDVRKDTLDGLVFNGGYRRALAGDLFWQAGLTLAALKSKQEVTGQLLVGTYREGLNYTPTKTGYGLGAFAGLQYRMSNEFYFELNVASVGYSEVNYIPFAYTGQPATTETKTKNKLVLDANLGFRF